MKKQFIAKFPLSVGPYQEFVNRIIDLASSGASSYVCVAAVHQLVEAHRDRTYTYISQHADLVTPDGLPLTWALRFLYNIKQDRVAGPDLLPDILKQAEKKKLSVFFYGGSDELLEKTKVFLKDKFPNLTAAGFYSPPFRPLTAQEDDAVCDMINQSGAQLVFVVLGCPKQERWMALMKDKIKATMVGIGAALPVLVGVQKRAPLWMQHTGLEWFYRLLNEPRRLWKRYLVTNTFFIYLLLKEKTKQHFSNTTPVSSLN